MPSVSGRSRSGADAGTTRGKTPASPATPGPRTDERPVCVARGAPAPRAGSRACRWYSGLFSGAPSKANSQVAESDGPAWPSQLLWLSSLERRLGMERRRIGDSCLPGLTAAAQPPVWALRGAAAQRRSGSRLRVRSAAQPRSWRASPRRPGVGLRCHHDDILDYVSRCCTSRRGHGPRPAPYLAPR